ncbi:MAG: cadherin-like domain-containing protein [Pirellulaceae bacterium]|nr:cadherin-like domain-containing protein [Pirellulaceae bacterium]
MYRSPRHRPGRHRSSFRRTCLETLEARRLLAVDALPVFEGYANEFTVRQDEPAPVALGIRTSPLGGPFRGDQIPVSVIDSGNGSVDFGRDFARQVLYQPEPGFVGVDIITLGYTSPVEFNAAESGESIPPAEQVRIAVNVVPPLLAIDDWFAVAQDSTEQIELDVLANDIQNANYIGDRALLSLRDVQTTGDGTVTLNATSDHLVYTPAANFAGVETISYTAVDEDGYTTDATVQVRVYDQPIDTLWPEQLQQQLVQAAAQHHQYSFGRGASQDDWYRVYTETGVLDDTTTPVATPTTDSDTSSTNNQIAEVDESDRIKTDGEFLYVLSSPDQDNWMGWDIFPVISLPRAADVATLQEGQPQAEQPQAENMLSVIDIRRPDTPTIVSRQILSDRVLSLDLAGDRLTVMSQRDNQTVVTVLDVTDATDIQTVSTTVVDGSFHQARRVDQSLYVFTNESRFTAPNLLTQVINDGEFSFYETGRDYLDRVADSLVDSILPSQEVFDSNGDPVDTNLLVLDPLEIGVADGQRMNIITFDTSSDVGGAVDWDVHNGGTTVLVTPDSIYLTQTHYNSIWRFDDDLEVFDSIPVEPTITTEIDRFSIAPDGTIDPSANGVVPGTLKNSFSLDEHDGLLRIATENSWRVDPDDVFGSNVYVLQQTDGVLQTIGGVTGLAPGESIYAVRFAGDRGYVVTFRRVDPLFVLDLSQPTNPQVMGELKISGYSQYLHIISADHVLGVGRDADPETGMYEGLTVSLFNVSDPANPTLQDRYLFEGGRSTFSPFAEDNPWDVVDHHAISFFPAQGVLALPFYTRDHSQDDPRIQNAFESAERSAVRTFRIDPDDGISVIDTIAFESRADRTLRVSDHLYSLSDEELKVTHLLQPDGIVASLQFERQGADDFADTPVGQSITLDVTKNDGIDLDTTVEILAASVVQGEGDVQIVDNQLRFTPVNQRLTPQRVRYTARDAAGTLIDAIATIDPDLIWQNLIDSSDVNGDGHITPRDIVNVINALIDHGANDTETIEGLIGDAANRLHMYVDANGDNTLSPADILHVISRLSDLYYGNATDPVSFDLNEPFGVHYQEIAQLNSDDLQLEVTAVLEDSRCAVDVVCVWEGQVRLELTVTQDDVVSTHELTWRAGQSTNVVVNDFIIEFLDVIPQAVSDQVIALDDYFFTLRVGVE